MNTSEILQQGKLVDECVKIVYALSKNKISDADNFSAQDFDDETLLAIKELVLRSRSVVNHYTFKNILNDVLPPTKK